MARKAASRLFVSLADGQALGFHSDSPVRMKGTTGRLGGSVGEASDFSSGHNLAVRGFESCVGLCADSSEPGACLRFCVSLSLSLSLSAPPGSLSVSLSKINKH